MYMAHPEYAPLRMHGGGLIPGIPGGRVSNLLTNQQVPWPSELKIRRDSGAFGGDSMEPDNPPVSASFQGGPGQTWLAYRRLPYFCSSPPYILPRIRGKSRLA